MEVVKVQNRVGGATKGAPRATGEGRSSPGQGYPPRGPHPRATTSIVPFTLSIAVAQPPSILILLFLPSTFR